MQWCSVEVCNLLCATLSFGTVERVQMPNFVRMICFNRFRLEKTLIFAKSNFIISYGVSRYQKQLFIQVFFKHAVFFRLKSFC